LVIFAKNGLEKHKKALFSAEMFPKTGLFCIAFSNQGIFIAFCRTKMPGAGHRAFNYHLFYRYKADWK
jgi:hypothetical protein